MIDFETFTHLTFDCYGTLIDWESGILTALAPVLRRHKLAVKPAHLLGLFARYEAEQEALPWQNYPEVLRGVMSAIAAEFDFRPDESDLQALPDSVGSWLPFPDTITALRRFKARYKLVIVSNIDDALFAKTAKRLEVEFDDVITAEQVRHYKPSPENFRFALKRLGVPPRQVLHVAQSLFHDHVPAKQLGFKTVWVNRPSRLPDIGLSRPADVRPDLEVRDLRSLIAMMDRGR